MVVYKYRRNALWFPLADDKDILIREPVKVVSKNLHPPTSDSIFRSPP